MKTIANIERWAEDRNLIKGSKPIKQFAKLISEAGELADAILKDDQASIVDGIGDMVVVLTILAAQRGTTLEYCVDQAYQEIKDRKGIMFEGTFVKSTDALYPPLLAQLGLKE